MTHGSFQILKDVIKVFKSKSDAVIYVHNGVFFCINTELSLVKVFTPKNGLYDQSDLNSLHETIHLADCISKVIQPHDYMNNVIDIDYNPYTYEFNVYDLKRRYTSIMFNLLLVKNSTNYILESTDFVNDPYYEPILSDIFSYGTGVGDIIKAKNSGYCFTIYKGLVPYNKSDKVSLYFIDDIFVPENYNGPKRFYTNFKMTKSGGVLDVFARNLGLF